MSTVLIAPDKFKGSLTATEVADAVARGVRRSPAGAEATCVQVPVADGGDGTLAAAVAAGWEHVAVTATGPTGEPVRTGYARHGDTAVVELADVSGLVRIPQGRLAPLTASSRGTGELVAAAIDAGCREVVLGIGGSACTDGGAGLLRALGADPGPEVPEGGEGLASITRLDLTALRKRLAGVRITVACDVDNPLLGEHGAAAVYGPQKGANPDQVATLEARLTHWADVVADAVGADLREQPGAGAAGGVGFAALAVLDATLRPGIALVLDLVGFADRLAGADLVVTGEGALDEQTLRGKAPAGVARSAASAGVPVVAVCGSNALSADRLEQAGIAAAYALTDLEPDVDRCLREPVPLLERLGEQLAQTHLSGAAEHAR
ncbi:MAG TPA: glycerate kinase [Nocardioidaceae bacterium]|nr:glycerate kinase [Nocardioidaceae bacterium]